MRKDKGLSGELDRIPMMTWIMFLKFLDDQEKVRESEAELKGIVFRLTIEPPYRWRDWAANEDGITGQELLAFVNPQCVQSAVPSAVKSTVAGGNATEAA